MIIYSDKDKSIRLKFSCFLEEGGSITLQCDSKVRGWSDIDTINVSQIEYMVFSILFGRNGNPINQYQIEKEISNRGLNYSSYTVKNSIAGLRRKISTICDKNKVKIFNPIMNVPKKGFYLEGFGGSLRDRVGIEEKLSVDKISDGQYVHHKKFLSLFFGFYNNKFLKDLRLSMLISLGLTIVTLFLSLLSFSKMPFSYDQSIKEFLDRFYQLSCSDPKLVEFVNNVAIIHQAEKVNIIDGSRCSVYSNFDNNKLENGEYIEARYNNGSMEIYIYVGMHEVKKRFLTRISSYYLISGSSVERNGVRIISFGEDESNTLTYKITLPTGSVLLLSVSVINLVLVFFVLCIITLAIIELRLIFNAMWLMSNIRKMDLKLEPVVKVHVNSYDGSSNEEVMYYEILSKFKSDASSAFGFICKLNEKSLCGFYTYYMLSNSELTYGIKVGVNIDVEDLYKYGDKIFNLFGNKENVCIELTENTSGVSYSSKVKEVISKYKTLGFKFALDDFGEGVNNLDSIKIVSPDSIKISRKLLVTSNGLDDSTLAIMDIIKNKYGMSVICEGVENKKLQLELLSRGYSFHQGYLYN
ncbi:EAL domain-containing protein [Vibrio cholerae]|uniref:EAL domain-containing protein n=1 Tax=Vibrio cholerae TaxID=666 RepID=UPI003966F3FC